MHRGARGVLWAFVARTASYHRSGAPLAIQARRLRSGWTPRPSLTSPSKRVSDPLRAVSTYQPQQPSADRCAERLVEATTSDDDDDGDGTAPTPVLLVEKAAFGKWREELGTDERTWLDALLPDGYASNRAVIFPGLASVAFCCDGPLDGAARTMAAAASLATALPGQRAYEVRETSAGGTLLDGAHVALGFALGAYSFDAYKSAKRKQQNGGGRPEKKSPSRLAWPRGLDATARENVLAAARATYLVRDLVTTPAEDMGPRQLAEACESLAARYPGATYTALVGDALLTEGYPMVHAVGRAACAGREPRVAKLEWGFQRGSSSQRADQVEKDLPCVVLVGKGVTFDTGGLDLKPAAGMLLMRKDMGGAAHALGLADMIMSRNLPVKLVVLLGCVENSVSGAAFRPGDVLTARNGRTTEIANTDAEGRLVMGDLLVEATERDPDLVVDFATLTGAGRVALGTDVAAMFSNDDGLALGLQETALRVNDPVWRLPLWPGYEKELDSPIADCKNVGAGPYGGCITAALYLQHFLKPGIDDDDNAAVSNGPAGVVMSSSSSSSSSRQPPKWIHLDMMAYNTKSTPGRPEGGEALGMRAVFELLKARYA